jgi:hypothetical protein
MNITSLSPTQLRKAADIQERIQSLQDELIEVLGASAPVETAETETPRKKWKVGAAGRARMRAAQLARWAKIKGTAPSEGPGPKKRRKMSAEGLANIRAGLVKRWAAQGKAVEKPKKKRKMSPAWRAALERAWEARRAKTKAAAKGKP